MRSLWLLAFVVAVSAASAAAWAAAEGGKLKVDTPGMVLEVEYRGRKVAIPPLREVPVGSGTFETKGIKLHAKGKDTKNRPAIWRLDGTKPFGKLEKIEVAGTGTTTVEGGAPLIVKTPARVYTKNGTKTLRVGLYFIGKSGEHYRTVVYMGRRRVSAPKIGILSEDGKVLDSGSFEYG